MGCDGACQPANGPPTSAWVIILPFLELQNLYDQFGGFPAGVPGSLSEAILNTRPPAFVCPSSTMRPYYETGGKKWAVGSYALCAGHYGPSYGLDARTKWLNSGMFLYRDPVRLAEATDGTSNVFLLGEVTDGHLAGNTNMWMVSSRHVDSLRTTDNPVNTPYQQGVTYSNYGNPCNGAFGSRHPGGANFANVDGSVHFISENINLALYRLLGQRGSGQPKQLP
jgi:hypothetical protein